MSRIATSLSILLATITLAALMLVLASAAPAAPAQRVTFTKEANNLTPLVGETFTFTLNFNSASTETQELQVRVTDPNPEPEYLKIITNSITGGATYSPTIDAVVWEGTLFPAGTQPQVVAFQLQVTGYPTAALASGYSFTNAATLVDMVTPGTLPEVTAEAAVRVSPLRLFLPFMGKN